MEVIRPVSELYYDFTVEETETLGTPSPYGDFDGSGIRYFRGDRVYSNPSDGGDGGNYEMQWMVSGVLGVSLPRPESDSSGRWRLISVNEPGATFEVASYNTDAHLSDYGAWASGVALSSGARVNYRNRDYEALVDLTTGQNVISPLSCVTSFGQEWSDYWLDLGPSNAFRLLDDKIATATKFRRSEGTTPTTYKCTLKAQGYADRICVWGLANVEGVAVTVNAGEIFSNPDFTSEQSDFSPFPNVSESWSAGAWTLTNEDYGTDGSGGDFPTANGQAWVIRTLDFLTVGKTYRLTVTTNLITGTDRQWRVVASTPGQSGTSLAFSTWQSTAGTISLDFTPTDDAATVWIQFGSDTQVLRVTDVSLKQQGYTQDTASKTLQDATTRLCRRKAILAHDACTCPEYEITFTGTDASRDIYVGMVSAGHALSFGCTHADVEVGNISFSRAAEDEYGIAKKLRKRAAQEFRAIVQLNGLIGDLVDQALFELEGRDASFDFNSSDTDYTRLQIHGWPRDWSTVVSGIEDPANPKNDTLVINMRSLVEMIRV